MATRKEEIRDVNGLKKDRNAKIVCHYWEACSLN